MSKMSKKKKKCSGKKNKKEGNIYRVIVEIFLTFRHL
jgi:hypothetical protein